MAWAKLVVLFSLVLGLPLLGLAQFDVDSLALKFQWHHVDPTLPRSRAYCNLKMEEQDMTQGCKPLNTFVHEPLEKVQAVCLQENVICKDGQTNCYRSKSKRHTTGYHLLNPSMYPNCRYQTFQKDRYIVVACQGNPFVPVHYETSEE